MMALAARKKCLIYLTLAILLFGLSAGPVSADVGLWASPPRPAWLAPPAWITAWQGTSTTRVYVEWAASTGASKYKLYRVAHGYSNWQELACTSSTSYHDFWATPAYAYDYAVSACDSACADCSSKSSRAVGYKRLEEPDDVNATDGDSTSSVTITWTASDQAQYYRVYRSTWAGGYKTDLGYIPGAYTTCLDTTGTPGTDYYYYVKAFKDDPVYDFDSDYSDYDMGYRRIGLPSGIWATDGTFTDKVVVSWGPVTGATSYEVYRGTNDSSWNTYWEGISTTYYWDISAIPGWFYYYWVVPCDSHGCLNSGIGPDVGWCVEPSPTPTDTEVPTLEPTPTASNTPKPPTPTASNTAKAATPTASNTAKPATPTPSNTPRPTITRRPTLSVSVTPWTPSAWLYLPLIMRD
jgi:fibronectin type 3 domain-containing protein